MHRAIALSALALAGCGGGGAASSETAALSAANAASRDAAQSGRVDNPEAFVCLRANSSDGEWAVIARQDEQAEAMLQTVLRREGTVRCFNNNNVKVYM